MSADVIEFASRERVEEAWSAYLEYARDIVDDPRLLTDRTFYQEFTRRHERWKRLFMAMEGPSS